MTTTSSGRLCAGLLLLLLGCSEAPVSAQALDPDAELIRWRLPSTLVEVSGLAVAGPHEIFAVDDESAWIYRINVVTGAANGRIAIGQPPVNGDFEGIAVHANVVYLVTSDGLLYAAPLLAGKAVLSYQQFDLGLGKLCEIEGLSEQPNSPHLWIICKQRYDNGAGLKLYAWSTESQQLVPALEKDLPQPNNVDKKGRFNPSGLAFSADAQTLLVIAARQTAFAWYAWSDTPTLMRAAELPNAKKHRQAEGVAIMPSGHLLVADEGKKNAGTIARYRQAF